MKEKATKMTIHTRALTRIITASIPLSLILVGCSSSNPIVSNYYADGIYYDSEYSGSYVAEELGLTDPESPDYPSTPTTSTDGYDYYDPSHVEPSIANSTSTSSDWNTYTSVNYGYSSWGGFQPSISFGMSYGYGYNPYMGYYNPYYGWGYPRYGYGFGYGYGSPYYMYGRPPYGYGYYNPYYPPYYGNSGWHNYNEKPLRGTHGRTYNGPTPNRYRNAPRGGAIVGGAGKMEQPSRNVNTSRNRVSREAAQNGRTRPSTTPTTRDQTRPATRTSRLRTATNERSREVSANRRPSNATPNRSTPSNRTGTLPTRTRENSQRTTPTRTRSTSNRPSRTGTSPTRNTSEREYNLRNRPTRTSPNTETSPARRTTPSRSSTPSRRSNSSSERNSRTIRRR